MNYKTVLLKEETYSNLNRVRLGKSITDGDNHSFDGIITYLLTLEVKNETI